MEVASRLFSRLKKVPGVTSDDIPTWITEAEEEAGITEEDNPNAILYLALAIAYESIAANSASYFKFTDGEEAVDKTNISSNFSKLADKARKNYRKQVRGRFGAAQSHLNRADEK